jgi:hypothetical protein
MTQSPRMAATTTTITTANPACVVHPQGFPVRDGDNCCPLRRWWNRGTIRLGREADLSVYSSGDIMTVHVTIDHPVSVEAQVVQVTCLETVTRQSTSTPGNTNAATRQHSVSRCLAQQVVPRADWKHRDRCHDGTSQELELEQPDKLQLFQATLPPRSDSLRVRVILSMQARQ